MEEQATQLLLEGITLAEFKILYLVGISGIVIRFLFNLGHGIRWDPNTPMRFDFPSFVKGLARIIVSLFVMALMVARFQEFSHLLIVIDSDIPATAGLTAGFAFIIGSVIDDVVKRLMSGASKQIQKRKKP